MWYNYHCELNFLNFVNYQGKCTGLNYLTFSQYLAMYKYIE